jgi:tetratricopeptide (TPR) repeat protein
LSKIEEGLSQGRVMLEDCYGCKVTTANQDAIDTINLFSTELVRLGKDAECILREVDNSVDSPLIQIYAAIFHLFGQTHKNFQTANRYLQRASKKLQECNEREKSWHHIATTWEKRKFQETLKLLEQHCHEWSNDLLAIKTCEYLYYCNGQKFQSERFLNLTQNCLKDNEKHAHFLSIHAFAHELCGNYPEAQSIAEKSIEIDNENPWAHHCLSHLYINRGECNKGAEILESFSSVWPRSNRMIESHNMWHLALLYLEQLEFDKVIEVYNRVGWENDAVTIGEEVDVAALLWRLDMEGYNVDAQWNNLGEAIIQTPTFPLIPFVNVQLCYALKRANKEQELNMALENIQLFIDKLHGEERHIWEEFGLPLMYGALLYADSQYEDAVNMLEPIIDNIGCVGGSDAQIALFHQTYFKSLVATKRKDEAFAFLKNITGDRPLTPLEQSWRDAC